MADGIIIALSFGIFVVYLIVFFLLLEIKSRINKGLSKAFNYMIIAIVLLIIIRIMNILSKFEIFIFDYLQEALVLVFSLFFLMFFIKFYRELCCVTDKKSIKNRG